MIFGNAICFAWKLIQNDDHETLLNVCIKGLCHPVFLAFFVSWLRWPMTMATTKAGQETTRARHAG